MALRPVSELGLVETRVAPSEVGTLLIDGGLPLQAEVW